MPLPAKLIQKHYFDKLSLHDFPGSQVAGNSASPFLCRTADRHSSRIIIHFYPRAGTRAPSANNILK